MRLKSAEIRLAEILLLAGQTLFDRYGAPADPYMTLVGYFNATRELAGMRRYLDDDVTTRVRRHGRRKGLSDRLTGASGCSTIAELTSRISSGDIATALKSLEIGFDPEIGHHGPPAGDRRRLEGASRKDCGERGRARADRPVAGRAPGRRPSTSCWRPRCSRSASTCPGSG